MTAPDLEPTRTTRATPAPDPRRSRQRSAVIVASIVVLLAALGLWQRRLIVSVARNWSDFSDGAELARQLKNADNVLEYIVHYPEQVSLAAFDVGDEEHGIFLNAERPRALASTVKLQLLCAYAGALERGEWRPNEQVPIREWERYWLPKIDGNAHERTFAQLRESAYIAQGNVQLQDIVYGMMRFSDNAAADYLMQRLGRARVEALPAQLGMPSEEAPRPFSGTFLSWQSTRGELPASALIARYDAPKAEAYRDEVWGWAEQLRKDPQLLAAEQRRLEELGLTLRLGEQAALARAFSVHGSAREYARLMARIKNGELPGSQAMQAELEWPMQLPVNRERFDSLGTKGGSLPGVATSATYAKPRGKDKVRVLALFFEGLPTAVWLQLMDNFVQQQFETRLLEDDAFFQNVKTRLSARPGPPGEP